MKMRSAAPGTSISDVEVTNISPRGVWILVGDSEFFLPFKEFPWFREATVAQIAHVTRPAAEHLRWPDLDVDLTLDSIRNPGAYPLVSRGRPNRGAKGGTARARPHRQAACGPDGAVRGGTRIREGA
jgi:hypothetical protein